MTLDANTEALKTVDLVLVAGREDAVTLVRAQLERFRAAGKIEAIEMCQKIFLGRAA